MMVMLGQCITLVLNTYSVGKEVVTPGPKLPDVVEGAQAVEPLLENMIEDGGWESIKRNFNETVDWFSDWFRTDVPSGLDRMGSQDNW